MKLFDKIPENFFSLLSRKYKSVYAFSLLTLYDTLKLYKTKIKKSDYLMLLRSRGADLMSLFDIALDRQDDKDDEDEDQTTIATDSSDDSTIAKKTNYICNKLVKTGWMEIERDPKTNIDYIFLPSYSIRFLELISELTSDVSIYLPLVHQTYSELKLEDEKEDDFMYRSLANARKNADELELSVTLLHHSICVFGHKLTSLLSPNDVLHQHFDNYRTEISDKIYHPMKTYDSLGLYAMPTITILKKWLHDERIVGKIANQARSDTDNVSLSNNELTNLVIQMLQETIDIFSKLNKAFDEIDKANADYTEAVQRKVNYLSSSDKSIKGKLDAIILAIAKDLTSVEDYDQSEMLNKASETINFYRQGVIDGDSLTMPFKRSEKEEGELLPIEDPLMDDNTLLNDFLDSEVNQFGVEAVEDFMIKAFGKKKEIDISEIELNEMDDVILLILGIVRAEFGDSFFSIDKYSDESIRVGRFLVPKYSFTKKG